MRERYGVEVDYPGADDRAVSEALAQAERDRAEADRQRSADRDGAEAVAVIGAAGREDRARDFVIESDNAAKNPEPPYDSEERRQSFAASLDGTADGETIRARILADRDQATPPSAAVEGAQGKVRKPARRGTGTTRAAKGPFRTFPLTAPTDEGRAAPAESGVAAS